MDAPTWVYASIVGVTVLHLFMFVYLQARRRGSAVSAPGPTASGDAGDAAGDGDDDTVRCRECGAENRRQFRFCRNCVTELPGASLAGDGGGAARPGVM